MYGDPQVHPQPEDYWGNVNPIGPRGVYDEAKRFAEAITMAYHRVPRRGHPHRPHLQHLRPAHARRTTAACCPPSSARPCAARTLTVFGDGSQTRSFCYVADLVEGIFRLLLSDDADPVNIGNPDEMTIRALRRDDHRASPGSASRIVERPLPVDDPKVRQPDITRARTILGWEPTVSLDEGLARTLAYFRRKLGL